MYEDISMCSILGQLLIEVHVHTPNGHTYYRDENTRTFLEKLESYGIGLFHSEINRHAPQLCTEFGLIQCQWRRFEETKLELPPLSPS